MDVSGDLFASSLIKDVPKNVFIVSNEYINASCHNTLYIPLWNFSGNLCLATLRDAFPENTKNCTFFTKIEVWKIDFPDFVSIKQTAVKTLKVLYLGDQFLN